MELYAVGPGHYPRHSFKQVSGSFFLWVTSGQGKLLTAQMGRLELRRQKWPSLKIILAEGTQSRMPKSILAHCFPHSPGCPQIRNSGLYCFRLLHTDGQLLEASPCRGSPLLWGEGWATMGHYLNRPAKACGAEGGKNYI